MNENKQKGVQNMYGATAQYWKVGSMVSPVAWHHGPLRLSHV